MSRQFVIWLLLSCLAFLTGCDLMPVRTEEKVIVLSPPQASRIKVEPILPPIISQYVNLPYLEKENILVEKFREQTSRLDTCNIQLKTIDEWVIKNEKLYNPKD